MIWRRDIEIFERKWILNGFKWGGNKTKCQTRPLTSWWASYPWWVARQCLGLNGKNRKTKANYVLKDADGHHAHDFPPINTFRIADVHRFDDGLPATLSILHFFIILHGQDVGECIFKSFSHKLCSLIVLPYLNWVCLLLLKTKRKYKLETHVLPPT